MATYSYRARDATGKAVRGTMDGDSKGEIVDKLHKMGFMPTQVTESLAGFQLEDLFARFKRVGTDDMIIFNVQLSNMINAGISILISLDTLSRQIENKRLREAVGGIRRNIEAGESFSDSLAKHRYIFSKLFINMIRAGEASGKLDTVLARYAEFYEHQADLRQKIKGALFYPMILLIAGVIVTLFIVTFIIPQFVQIFTESGIRLPVPTVILYRIGTALKDYWYAGLLVVIIVWLAVKSYAKTARGRLRIDRLKLKLPIIGPIQRKAAISRFARTLGTLVASGVPILESLDIVKEVVANEVLAGAVTNARITVERGERMAEPLRVSEEFPADTVQMISVGEESGNLDGMLNKISDFYDMSLGYTIKRLTALIEPIFLVVMGSIIGFIMASMLLPIFDMIQMLRH